jgi:hypothetical protein
MNLSTDNDKGPPKGGPFCARTCLTAWRGEAPGPLAAKGNRSSPIISDVSYTFRGFRTFCPKNLYVSHWSSQKLKSIKRWVDLHLICADHAVGQNA